MPRLFMSYARETRPQVERLAADLRNSGYEPFFDEQLVGGQNWWDELLHRIESADAFMPILGSDYLNSEPCRLEAEYASALRRPFLPIAIENLPPQLFAEVISQAQWAAYQPQNPQSVLAVIRAINSLGPPPALPDPPPPRPQVPISYMTELQQEIGGDGEIHRVRQLQIVADLRSRLTTGDRDAARLLLTRMRQRSDVGYQIAMDIDQVLGNGPASTPAAAPLPPPHEEPAPRREEAVRQEAPRQEQPRQEAPRYEPQPTYPRADQPPHPQAPPTGKPSNYLVWSILTTLLCCLPFGIVAIVQSVKVDSLWSSGQYAEATAASKKAKMWSQIAAGTGAVLILLYVVVVGLSASSSSS